LPTAGGCFAAAVTGGCVTGGSIFSAALPSVFPCMKFFSETTFLPTSAEMSYMPLPIIQSGPPAAVPAMSVPDDMASLFVSVADFIMLVSDR